jgi:hypothetical protein
MLVVLTVFGQSQVTGSWHSAEATGSIQDDASTPVQSGAFLPLMMNSALPAVQWDPRLTQRGAELVPAKVISGEGYWRLIQGIWYAENESPMAGQHHIFVDILDESGNRQPCVSILITTSDGLVEIGTTETEEKSGELFATNWPMWEVAPLYRVLPVDDASADAVIGM